VLGSADILTEVQTYCAGDMFDVKVVLEFRRIQLSLADACGQGLDNVNLRSTIET
jgi:hypothetical protein